MFHLYLTLAYILPNVYVFFRIRNLFISKGYRGLYTIIYLMLVLIFPVSERFTHGEMNLARQILSTISGYTLPFFLYVFLLVLLFDLFLLLNRMTRIIPGELLKIFNFRMYTLITIVTISSCVVVYGIINLNTIRVSAYSIEIPKRHSQTDHLRIAFAADFHLQQNTPVKFIEQFVQKVNALQPDLILYGGDMTEGDREDETTEKVESILRKVHAGYGVYGVLGNHEFYGRQDEGDFFRKAGITLLCDTVIKIDSAFYLAGRYDEHFGRRKTIGEILEAASEDLPVIIMDHRPTQIQEVSRTKTDVQFSGHTHNGQLFPINLFLNSIYILKWGYRKVGNTHFFVTSGLRLWGPPVKTAGKSEIILVDIHFKPSNQ